MSEIELAVPHLGDDPYEAIVGSWFVQSGATVAKGDILVELEMEKLTYDLEAPVSGVLEIIALRDPPFRSAGSYV